jgi:chaperonin GroEL (HSP60 family)
MTMFSRVSKNPVVPQKVREAFRLLQDDSAMTLQLAAAAVKMDTYKLREALQKPHVRKWIANERRLQLDAICAANPEALRKIRDSSENDMARVNSVKTLETMKELIDPSAVRAGAQVHSPGLVVQIINGASGEVERTIGAQPPVPMIDVTPEREALEPPGR